MLNFFTRKSKLEKLLKKVATAPQYILPLGTLPRTPEWVDSLLERTLYMVKTENESVGTVFLEAAHQLAEPAAGIKQVLAFDVVFGEVAKEDYRNANPYIAKERVYPEVTYKGVKAYNLIPGVPYKLETKLGLLLFVIEPEWAHVAVMVADKAILDVFIQQQLDKKSNWSASKSGSDCYVYKYDPSRDRLSGGEILERGLDTYADPNNTAKFLLKRLQEFIEVRSLYVRLGFKQKMGVLLHGPPGTGKTVLPQVLAKELQLRYIYAPLGRMGADAFDSFGRCVRSFSGSIVVLEDVDCFNSAVSRDGDDEPGQLSVSQLFAFLDGPDAAENIVFLTTNHPEKLDPALIRDGRIDYRLEIPRFTLEQAVKFWKLLGEKFEAALTPELFVELLGEHESYAPSTIEARAKEAAFEQLVKNKLTH
jgi:hypothetical protein